MQALDPELCPVVLLHTLPVKWAGCISQRFETTPNRPEVLIQFSGYGTPLGPSIEREKKMQT